MSKEDKVILVVRKTQFGNCKADYYVEKWATSLDEASRYQVSLETLNDDKENVSMSIRIENCVIAIKNNNSDNDNDN